jgi:hypothetical protein
VSLGAEVTRVIFIGGGFVRFLTGVGLKVGYCIRFEDCSGPDTRIKFVTDGVLLREMMLGTDELDVRVLASGSRF